MCLSKGTPSFDSLTHIAAVVVVVAAVAVVEEVVFFEKHLKVEYLEGINEESLNGKLCRQRKCCGGYDDGGRLLKRRERG